jgi:hypothetical protein
MVHPHAWPFITAPLMQEQFLGESLNDLGISASILLPTGEVYTRLTVDLLRGTAIGDATGMVDSLGGTPYYANSARLSSFFTLGDFSDVEVGVSGYTGIHDPYTRDRFWYGNLDFKHKYRPDSYTSLVIQGISGESTHRPSCTGRSGIELRLVSVRRLPVHEDLQCRRADRLVRIALQCG